MYVQKLNRKGKLFKWHEKKIVILSCIMYRSKLGQVNDLSLQIGVALAIQRSEQELFWCPNN